MHGLTGQLEACVRGLPISSRVNTYFLGLDAGQRRAMLVTQSTLIFIFIFILFYSDKLIFSSR